MKKISNKYVEEKITSFQPLTSQLKPINEIIKELTTHPDYINHLLWTQEGVKLLIRSKIENYYKNGIDKDYIVDKIYNMNKEIISDAIGICIDVSYKEFFSLDFINYPQDFVQLDKRVIKKLREVIKK